MAHHHDPVKRSRVTLNLEGASVPPPELVQRALAATDPRLLPSVKATAGGLTVTMTVTSALEPPPGSPGDGWWTRLWMATEPVDHAFEVLFDAVKAHPPMDLIGVQIATLPHAARGTAPADPLRMRVATVIDLDAHRPAREGVA